VKRHNRGEKAKSRHRREINIKSNRGEVWEGDLLPQIPGIAKAPLGEGGQSGDESTMQKEKGNKGSSLAKKTIKRQKEKSTNNVGHNQIAKWVKLQGIHSKKQKRGGRTGNISGWQKGEGEGVKVKNKKNDDGKRGSMPAKPPILLLPRLDTRTYGFTTEEELQKRKEETTQTTHNKGAEKRIKS